MRRHHPRRLTVGGCIVVLLTVMQYYFSFLVHDEVPQYNQEAQDLQQQQQKPLNRLYHVGRFGLGHRLSKLSAAYHLARNVLHLPQIEMNWGSCQTKEIDVFAFLFGTHTLPLREGRRLADEKDQRILVRNDVAGYYAGQSYKNAQVIVPPEYDDDDDDDSNSTTNSWKNKLQLDRILFHDLVHRFTERTPELIQFQQEHNWHTHTVIGLHVRIGNGEQDHFAASGRLVVTNTTTLFLQNVCLLLRKYAAEYIHPHGPVLLFLATDTEHVIATVQRACHSSNHTYPAIPVVVFPQPRVEASQGVSYHAWEQGQACFQGWKSSMMDMALLAHSNILVAGMRSTFTQIVPRALVMGQKEEGRFFCEVDETTGRTMTCWDKEDSWLFRRLSDSTTCSLDDPAVVAIVPVVHKLLVHLPDVEPNAWIEKAKAFLKRNESSSVFAYGERFDSKYRTPGQTFRKDWTLAEPP